MDKKKILEYCRNCKSKKITISGLRCALTGEFPVIDVACSDRIFDVDLVKAQQEKENLILRKGSKQTIITFGLLALFSIIFTSISSNFFNFKPIFVLLIIFMILTYMGYKWGRILLSILLVLAIIGGLLTLFDLFTDYSSKVLFIGMVIMIIINLVALGFVRKNEVLLEYLEIKRKRKSDVNI